MTRIGTEVKFTLPADQVDAGRDAFGLEEDDAEERVIWFFDRLDDDGDPWLLAHHVILRLRADARDEDDVDVTVKLRPAREERLTGRWRPGTEHRGDYRVEIDWAREKVLAASVEADRDESAGELLDGPRKEVFTAEQQDFLRRCGPELEQPLRHLRAAGPIAALRWKDLAVGPVGDVRAEQWTWAEGRTFLELSVRCADDDEAAKQRELLAAELDRHGLRIDDAGMTKTEAVLRDLL